MRRLVNSSKARKLETEIKLEYDDPKDAETVAKSVSPDNSKAPAGLSIETTYEGKEVVTYIKCEKGIHTAIATIDDLLFCVSTAEKILSTIKRIERQT